MNGDGYNDIAIGAFDATITSGFVFVYGGGPRLDSTFDAAVGITLDSFFGYSIANIGDVSGDGLADIIIGAPNYEFGNEKGYWGIFLGDSAIKVTDVREKNLIPSVFTLFQSYPNPFNPKTTILYDLKEVARVTLDIINVLGQRIITLIDEQEPPGSHQTVFDGSSLSSGIYFYRLTAKTEEGKIYTDTKKLTLIK
jgi:hypothetical protein